MEKEFPLSNFGAPTRGEKLLQSLESSSTPIAENIKEQTVNVDGTEQPQKIFTVEKAGALKEINFKFANKPSKEEY